MAYVTGVANDFAGLKAALVGACTANGWTLDGNVLHKGAVFVELLTTELLFSIKGGTGIGASNVLTGAASAPARIGSLYATNVVFPATYHVHVLANPDEVYFLVNYNVDFWQWMAFGISDVPGLSGTGAWFGAALPQETVGSILMTPSLAGNQQAQQAGFGLFFDSNSAASVAGLNSSIHHGLDGLGWSLRGSQPNGAQALAAVVPKYARQPNAWNAASALINFQVYVARPSSKQSLVLDAAHVRLVRVDFVPTGDVITLGSERWKAYPWHRRDTVNRDGGSQHTGTMGWAIRYDGP